MEDMQVTTPPFDSDQVLRNEGRREALHEVRQLIEKAAKAHDHLAIAHPSGPDKVKAETLRRFADVFLPEQILTSEQLP